MSSVAVIDYGMGNLHSVAKALEHAGSGEDIIVTHDAAKILAADRVVLPGVGAIRDCMHEIKRLGIDEVVSEVVKSKPLLGVCIGMQALTSESEENGGTACLDLFHGKVRFFGEDLKSPSGDTLKVPHMGWNQVHQVSEHPLWQGIEQDERFYFVHSYYVESAGQRDTAATTTHGLEFAAALHRDNIFATQFHPEKSQHAGLQLYRNFLNWNI